MGRAQLIWTRDHLSPCLSGASGTGPSGEGIQAAHRLDRHLVDDPVDGLASSSRRTSTPNDLKAISVAVSWKLGARSIAASTLRPTLSASLLRCGLRPGRRQPRGAAGLRRPRLGPAPGRRVVSRTCRVIGSPDASSSRYRDPLQIVRSEVRRGGTGEAVTGSSTQVRSSRWCRPHALRPEGLRPRCGQRAGDRWSTIRSVARAPWPGAPPGSGRSTRDNTERICEDRAPRASRPSVPAHDFEQPDAASALLDIACAEAVSNAPLARAQILANLMAENLCRPVNLVHIHSADRIRA